MPVELNIASETVRLIVEKARMIEAEMEKNLEHEPDLEPVPVGANEHHTHATLVEEEAEDPTEAELRELIGDLNVDEAVELVALAWIGRGDFAPAEWPEALRDARGRAETRRNRIANYLLGMPLLADHLEAGLDALIAHDQ
ncbi:MAG TPA: DUF3775 domain-containing protein [Afifellaceae bacterium]|nr:DUF3775 domain-containing protein [Afifellaceae bacterium]